MKPSRKILFIKNRPDSAFARSWIVDDLGMHSRIIGDAALLGRVLTGETFDLVLLDQRGSNEELIPSIEGMRQYQPHAKLVIVSDSVALSDVQQAMRLNVHDIFLPPFELAPIIERVDAVFARLNGSSPSPAGKVLARWSEIAATLHGELDAMFGQSDSSTGAGGADAGKTAAPSVADLQQQLDRQSAELDKLREQLAAAGEERARLSEQFAQVSAAASALGRAEARARSLEAEVVELRKGAIVSGPEGAALDKARDELERARERITELERLNQGLLAGATGGASPENETRVRELEAELADVNARFEAAGQAFATEMEQVMAREAEAMAALAAAEERERKAQAVMATAGDAFGRADESLERERAEIQAQREALKAGQAELRDALEALEKRAAAVDARAKRLDAASAALATEFEGSLIELGKVIERAQGLLGRREEIRSMLGR